MTMCSISMMVYYPHTQEEDVFIMHRAQLGRPEWVGADLNKNAGKERGAH